MSSVGPPLALDYFTQRTQPLYDSQIDESSVPSSVDRASESPLRHMTLSLSSRPGPTKPTLRLKDPSSPIAYREPNRSPSTSLSPNHKSPFSDSDNNDDEDSDPTPRRTPTKGPKHGQMPMHTSTETSSLLGSYPQSYSTLPVPLNPHLRAPNRSLRKRVRAAWTTATNGAKTVSQPSYIAHLGFRVISLFPAVFLGLLLNVLDGVSYGMIMFPPLAIFDGFGPMGVSLFFVTYVFPTHTLGSFSDPTHALLGQSSRSLCSRSAVAVSQVELAG